eukprot:2795605-Pleurochrysis_carterae.AAC.3
MLEAVAASPQRNGENATCAWRCPNFTVSLTCTFRKDAAFIEAPFAPARPARLTHFDRHRTRGSTRDLGHPRVEQSRHRGRSQGACLRARMSGRGVQALRPPRRAAHRTWCLWRGRRAAGRRTQRRRAAHAAQCAAAGMGTLGNATGEENEAGAEGKGGVQVHGPGCIHMYNFTGGVQSHVQKCLACALNTPCWSATGGGRAVTIAFSKTFSREKVAPLVLVSLSKELRHEDSTEVIRGAREVN